MLEWFPRMIMMAVAIIVIAMLVRYYSNRDVDAASMTRAAHLYRLYYGDVIMYQDGTTKRVYPGIVDMSKFTDERLKEVFNTDARLSSCIITKSSECPQYDKTICFNKELFELSSAQASLIGPGGASVETHTYPVTIKDKETTCLGSLNITIARPNK
jgi:hypothetical protein